jgi:hypothetical protein
MHAREYQIFHSRVSTPMRSHGIDHPVQLEGTDDLLGAITRERGALTPVRLVQAL